MLRGHGDFEVDGRIVAPDPRQRREGETEPHLLVDREAIVEAPLISWTAGVLKVGASGESLE